jgi:protein required for attachment to host cells
MSDEREQSERNGNEAHVAVPDRRPADIVLAHPVSICRARIRVTNRLEIAIEGAADTTRLTCRSSLQCKVFTAVREPRAKDFPLFDESTEKGSHMNIRIVVADERRATFFDAPSLNATALSECGAVENPTGRLKDIDLETDRAGRRFGGSAGGGGHGPGQGQGRRHGVDGEKSTVQHDLTLFAKEVGRRIDADRVGRKFDKLVIVAPPKMLGLLRQTLPAPLQSMVAGEIAKDLTRQGPDAIVNTIPRDAFFQ